MSYDMISYHIIRARPSFLSSGAIGLPALSLSHDLMQSVGRLHEYRGREQLYTQQARQELGILKEVAIIRSAESSNRMKGVEALPERIKKLMQESAAPETRSEHAIAGYRDVLSLIHTRHEDIELSSGVVRQFHRDLLPCGGRVANSDRLANKGIGICRESILLSENLCDQLGCYRKPDSFRPNSINSRKLAI